MGPGHDDPEELLGKIICRNVIRNQVPAITTIQVVHRKLSLNQEKWKRADRDSGGNHREALGTQEAG